MKKKIILSLTILSSIFSMSFSSQKSASAGANEVEAPSQDYLESTKDNTIYYNDWEISGLSKNNLLNQLAKKMTEEHQYYTSYEDVKGANAYSDEDPDDETKLISFYAGADISNSWSGGSLWNREHVWCKNLSGNLYKSVAETGRGAGADIHQLKPAISRLNVVRSDRLYAELNHQGTSIDYNNKPTGCFYDKNNNFEPRDEIKGDVARILMYMYTHYSSEIESNVSRVNASNTKTTSKSGDMRIENIVATEANNAKSSWNLLLKWNEKDPVDSFEAKRNDYCASITGLRNPFIDHPEFATMIWDEDYQGDGALLDSNYILSNDVPLVSMNFYHSNVFMRIGDQRKLNIDFHPYYVSKQYKEVTWESTNPDVALVENSLLVAKSKGTAIIKAVSGSLFAECEVTVDDEEKAAIYTIDSKTSVKESGNILAGTLAEYSQTHQNKGQMAANHSTTLVLKGYTDYRITGIRFTMHSNKSAGSGGLKVTISDTEIAYIPNNTPFDSNLWAGKYSQDFISVPIELKNNTRKILKDEIVTIQITASVNSLYIDSYAIEYTNDFSNIPIPPTGISLNQTKVTLKKNETFQLIATVLPENAEKIEISFYSERPNVASCTGDGIITALKKGEANIIAMSKDGKFSASCKVIVEEEGNQNNGCAKSSMTFIFSFAFLGILGVLLLKKKEM